MFPPTFTLALAALALAALPSAGFPALSSTEGFAPAPAAEPVAGTSATRTGESAAGPVLNLEKADRLEYLERERKVHLTGNVRLVFDANTILADDILIDLDKNLITAEGHLVWEGEEHRATGSRMTYNTKTQEGWVEDVTLTTGSWVCRGKRVDQAKQESVEVAPGVITTCNLAKPHWHIWSKKIRIRLKKDLQARDVTLYAGTTPILWLPFLATPLRDFRLPFEAQVGKTSELGAYVRTSPSFSLANNYPSQAHIDYFSKKGWGYGLTQDIENGAGERMLRLHGYRIEERGAETPGTPRERWELFALGAARFRTGTSLAGRVDDVSDAGFRTLYGTSLLPVSTASGERHASILLGQKLPGAQLTVMAERTETRRVGYDSSTRYVLSEIHAPQVSLAANPVPLASWLSLSTRANFDRFYRWQDSWYVDSASLVPSLEAFWRLPVLGSLTETPRLTGAWRDRGSRILLLNTAQFEEDVNRGFLWSGDNSASLRTPLPIPGFETETTHMVAKRFNKIGYDPFGYDGLDAHTITEKLMASYGFVLSASVRTGYDLRNRQDPSLRRWMPVTPELSFNPHPDLSLSAEADYDLWFGRFRRASSTLGLGRSDGPIFLRIRPSYTNNRLALNSATRTMQDYRMAEYLYADSFQSSLAWPEVFYVDAEAGFPIAPGLRAGVSGQYDAQTRQVTFYSLTLTRDLHCWEAEGSFHRYVTGELRFAASLHLKAFPKEAIPLITL